MTILRRILGARAYQILLAVLLFATLVYQKETGVALPTGQVPSDPESAPVSGESVAQVTRVIDGDTFEIEGGERVRLIGIDTPESVKPNSTVECFGKEASEYLKSLIEGKEVRLERDRTDRDRYARLLRYAYLGEVFVNEKVVIEGYAESVAYKPDTAKQGILDRAEAAAKIEQRSRWTPGVCP
jgi:micrococcal nuclease